MQKCEAYQKLCEYTLSKQDAEFIHQLFIDAHTAQTASKADKPIGLVFALVGLCLHIEFGFDGRQVQKAHMLLARRKHDLPKITIPDDRGETYATRILAIGAGTERDAAIHQWTKDVWAMFAESERQKIRDYLANHQIAR